jgi:competence protein ComEA
MEWLGRYRSHILLSLAWIIVCGAVVFYERRPQLEPVSIIEPTSAPVATVAPIRVHVVGAIRQPGVYALPPGSRWLEAVEAAGGLTTDADAESVNLADHVVDGQQIRIPQIGLAVPPSPTPSNLRSGSVVLPAAGGRVNINTASAQELDTLPGIGPTYAARIIAYREEHGPFQDPADVMQVKGIGPACYEGMRDLITVN